MNMEYSTFLIQFFSEFNCLTFFFCLDFYVYTMNLTLYIPTRATKPTSGNQFHFFLETFLLGALCLAVPIRTYWSLDLLHHCHSAIPFTIILEIPSASLLCWLPCLLELISSFLIYFLPLVGHILQQLLVSPCRLWTPWGLPNTVSGLSECSSEWREPGRVPASWGSPFGWSYGSWGYLVGWSNPLWLPQSSAMAWDGVALWAKADLPSFSHSIILTSSQQSALLRNGAVSCFCGGPWTWGSPRWEDAGTLVGGAPGVPSVDVRNIQTCRKFLWVSLGQTDDICQGERSQRLLSITSLNVDNQQNSKASSGL